VQQQKRRTYLSPGLALLAAMPPAAQVVPAPETVLGFVAGAGFFNALKPYRKTGKP